MPERDDAGIAEDQVEREREEPEDRDLVEDQELARQTMRRLPGNLPSVTGAAGARILGGIYPA